MGMTPDEFVATLAEMTLGLVVVGFWTVWFAGRRRLAWKWLWGCGGAVIGFWGAL